MRKTILCLILLLFISLGCGTKKEATPHTVRLAGSTTVSVLARYWAEAYMTLNPGISIYVEVSNSAEGLAALIDGETDIGMTSRLIRPQEASKMAANYRSIGISYLVAKDALSVYLHPKNPVKSLSKKQLRDIFSGKITNWQQLGGPLRPILATVRPTGSGTHNYFKNYVLQGEAYSENAITVASNKDVVDFVMLHPGAIGYGGIAFGDSLTHATVDGIEASEKNVLNDSYPLVRYLYLYTVDTPPPYIRDFINWVISPGGQAIVRQVGYIPLWPTQ